MNIVTDEVRNNFRFPGQYFDQETGLHYNYFRDYSSAIGRYIEPDPIGLEGGVNLYPYVLNNPVNHIDPEGKFIILFLAPGVYTVTMALADLAIIGGSWWLLQTALQSQIESDCNNPCEILLARPRGEIQSSSPHLHGTLAHCTRLQECLVGNTPQVILMIRIS